MRRVLGAAAAAAVLISSVAACGSGAADEAVQIEDARFSVQAALGQLQQAEVDGAVTIQAADLTAATEASGLQRPADLDVEALHQWIGPLIGRPGPGAKPAAVHVPLAPLFNAARLSDHQEFADELGWSLLDVEWFAEVATPPSTFAVVGGDFDETTLSANLKEVADGVLTAGEGDDFHIDLSSRSVARPHGDPLRLAQNGGRIAVGRSTDTVTAWASGTGTTYADHEALAAVAAALDEADVISATLIAGASMSLKDAAGPAMTPEEPTALADKLGPLLPTDPFDTIGIGWAAEDGESVITVAYHFESDNAAQSAVPAFEKLFAEGQLIATQEPLSERIILENAASNGQTVTLTLSLPEGQSPATINDMLHRRDVPFVHQ